MCKKVALTGHKIAVNSQMLGDIKRLEESLGNGNKDEKKCWLSWHSGGESDVYRVSSFNLCVEP